MTEAEEKALREFDRASIGVKKSLTDKPGINAENIYGSAYTKLVSLGLRPKLRARYR